MAMATVDCVSDFNVRVEGESKASLSTLLPGRLGDVKKVSQAAC